MLPTTRWTPLFMGAGTGLLLLMACNALAAPPQKRPAASAAHETKVPVPAPPATVRYNHDIRPILAENCFACHGPDSASRKADMRLDRVADATAMRNGHAVIVPGNPAASEMIRRITGQGPQMPPPPSH